MTAALGSANKSATERCTGISEWEEASLPASAIQGSTRSPISTSISTQFEANCAIETGPRALGTRRRPSNNKTCTASCRPRREHR